MFVPTPKGFVNTPVSKYLFVWSTGLPVIISLVGVKYLFELNLIPQIWEWHQWWRLIIWQLAYSNQSEVMFGALLFYNYRVLERMMGSNKYLSYILVCFGYTILVTFGVMIISELIPFTPSFSVPAGSTSILFALLVQYYDLVPVVYRFEVLGIHPSSKITLTDRIFIFLVSFQLATTHLFRSIVSAWIGWAIGILVTRDVIPGKDWRIPYWKQLVGRAPRNPPQRPADESIPPQQNEEAAANRWFGRDFLDTFRR